MTVKEPPYDPPPKGSTEGAEGTTKPVENPPKGLSGLTGIKEESSDATIASTKGPTVSKMSVHEYNQSMSAYTEGTKKHTSAAVA